VDSSLRQGRHQVIELNWVSAIFASIFGASDTIDEILEEE
jgi:hypothetical protein